MGKFKDYTGCTFGDFTAIRYLGKKRYLIKCNLCNEEKEILTTNMVNNRGVTCSKKKVKVDLTGETIGEWEVLRYTGNGRYLCRCSCGKEKEVLKANLLNGSSLSCGHSHSSYGDLTGKQFGEWTVLGKEGYRYRCRCSCGKEQLINSSDLYKGKTKSCGHNYNAFSNITGQTFGSWTVLSYEGHQLYKCQCSCQNKTIQLVRKADLLSGKSNSCGCNKYDKAKETLLERYGDTAPNKASNPRTEVQIHAIESKESLKHFIDNLNYTPTALQLSKELGLQLHRTLVLVHRYNLELYLNNTNISEAENELYGIIKSIYGGNIDKHNRTVIYPYELDIYIPDKRLAIGFNGNYWHSYIFKDKMYHYNKTVLCGKKGIRLIHIFEYEWNDMVKRTKIIDMLNNILNEKHAVVKYARNLEITEIDKESAIEFENKYHLQNGALSNINIALKDADGILGVMTFGIPRFNRKYEYELIRLCYKSKVRIVGGTSRMFTYFINKYKPNSVITYCDASKFSGNSYLNLGFEPIDEIITSPNYVWFDTRNSEVYSRYQTQKQKLIEGGIGSIDQTEEEIMSNLECIKIYDSGSIKLAWRSKVGE